MGPPSHIELLGPLGDLCGQDVEDLCRIRVCFLEGLEALTYPVTELAQPVGESGYGSLRIERTGR